MEMSDELIISTPLKSPFILDNKILCPGFAFDKKISDEFRVNEATAGIYLQHCMNVFSESENIRRYKSMKGDALLSECINEINKIYYGNQRHYNNHSSNYLVSTSIHQRKQNGYKDLVESDDDELPTPTNNFGNNSRYHV
jgi:hypothetical protein